MSETARPTRTRRQRSAIESLLSIVLGLEAVLMFFVLAGLFAFLGLFLFAYDRCPGFADFLSDGGAELIGQCICGMLE